MLLNSILMQTTIRPANIWNLRHKTSYMVNEPWRPWQYLYRCDDNGHWERVQTIHCYRLGL